MIKRGSAVTGGFAGYEWVCNDLKDSHESVAVREPLSGFSFSKNNVNSATVMPNLRTSERLKARYSSI